MNATTTNNTTATTTATRKSPKQQKREAADAKLAAKGDAPAKVTPIYAKPEAKPETPAAETPAPAPQGHNSNKGRQIAMNTVGPKRELAYAVVGLFATIDRLVVALANHDGAAAEALASDPNVLEARASLVKHGYGQLRPRAERIEALREQLKAAAEAGDLPKVTELAKQMKAIQDGRAD